MRARIHDLEGSFDRICEAVKLSTGLYWYDACDDRYLFPVGAISPFYPIVRILDDRRKE